MTTHRAGVLAITIATIVASDAIAQCTPGGPANPTALKRAIVGIVMDTAHQVLENVTVGIKSPRRQAKTNAQGRFTLSDLDTGTYEISVYRIGYETAKQSYVVTDSGGLARFCLIPEPRALPSMVTSATRPGLSGVIGDSNYKALEGAEVRVLGAGLHALTDTAGQFYLPVKKGTYPVQVSKAGYAREMLSVTIPDDSGRQIAVWLGSAVANANAVAARLEEMHQRVLWSRPNRSALISAEQIARSGSDLNGVAGVMARAAIKSDCEAAIDGTSFTLPLYMIDKADVLLMEVYLQGSARDAPTSIAPGGTQGAKTISPGARSTRPPTVGGMCPSVWVWLKR